MEGKVLLIPENSYLSTTLSRVEDFSEVAKEVGSKRLEEALDKGKSILYKGALYFVDIPFSTK